MPAEREAATWAKKLGSYRPSRALGVRYETLRRKTAASERGEDTPAFAEFSGAQLMDAANGPVVELAGAAAAVDHPAGRRAAARGSSGGSGRPSQSAAMIQVTPQMRVLVAAAAVDFRNGIELAQLCRAQLGADPMSGTVFVFRNRRATAVKVLVADGQGYRLCQKRLSSGRFRHGPRAS